MASSKDNAPVPASLVIDKTRCLNGSQIGAALAEVSFPTIHWHEGARVASASAPLLVSAFRWRSVGPFRRNATSQKSPGLLGFLLSRQSKPYCSAHSCKRAISFSSSRIGKVLPGGRAERGTNRAPARQFPNCTLPHGGVSGLSLRGARKRRRPSCERPGRQGCRCWQVLEGHSSIKLTVAARFGSRP